MKVIVLGAGIIGVTSAYFLAKQGYEVEVIDKAKSSATGCSFANGGQLSYSHIDTWASKSFILDVFKALLKPNSFVSVKDLSNKDFYKWFYQFIENSKPEIAIQNSLNLYKISSLSANLMTKILGDEPNFRNGESFDYSQKGILHFYRNEKLLQKNILKLEQFKKINLSFEIFNSLQCVESEPLLEKSLQSKNLAGGIYFPNDSSGDCFKFTSVLEKICREKYGVKFTYDCEVKNILTNYKRITGINTSNGVIVADKYLYALGAISTKLIHGIGIKSLIYPVKGYSLSIKNTHKPLSNIALTDNENKIVYSKLENILRVAGTVELNGCNPSSNQKHLNFLHNIVAKTFNLDYNKTSVYEWQGVRPFRPNSLPLIGRVLQLDNLYLNSGHGSLGWTNSLASGNLVCKAINHENFDDFDFLNDEFKHIYNR